MFKIIQKRKIWYGLSLLFLIPGMLSLILWGLRLGNDFTGGSLLEYKFSKQPEISAINDMLAPLDLGKFSLSPVGSDGLTIKLKPIDQETVDKITNAVRGKIRGCPDAEL